MQKTSAYASTRKTTSDKISSSFWDYEHLPRMDLVSLLFHLGGDECNPAESQLHVQEEEGNYEDK
jgi:hypothetical protein